MIIKVDLISTLNNVNSSFFSKKKKIQEIINLDFPKHLFLSSFFFLI